MTFASRTVSNLIIYFGNILAAIPENILMENLFSTNISVNDKNAVYNVVFDEEKYVFLPETKDKELPSFSFKRENDEWHDQELLAPDLKKQAVNALENYLLAQH